MVEGVQQRPVLVGTFFSAAGAKKNNTTKRENENNRRSKGQPKPRGDRARQEDSTVKALKK